MSPQAATNLPELFSAVAGVLAEHADEVTELDQTLGDGDHVFNLQRGIDALLPLADELSGMEWSAAFQKIGMTVMSTIGGASGSLYGTLFVTLGKAMRGKAMDLASFADAFAQAVDAVKARGKADQGDKTMLDVLIPAAQVLRQYGSQSLPLNQVLAAIREAAAAGLESTRDLLATKGRASFLGERARGHLDAGAKTSQLMIGAISNVLTEKGIGPVPND